MESVLKVVLDIKTRNLENEYILNYYKEHGIYEKILDDAANQPSASVIMY